jgi:hypothetical protein
MRKSIPALALVLLARIIHPDSNKEASDCV